MQECVLTGMCSIMKYGQNTELLRYTDMVASAPQTMAETQRWGDRFPLRHKSKSNEQHAGFKIICVFSDIFNPMLATLVGFYMKSCRLIKVN